MQTDIFFVSSRFVRKYVQDISNSTGADSRTLPECAGTTGYTIKKKVIITLSFCLKAVTIQDYKTVYHYISGRVFHNLYIYIMVPHSGTIIASCT